jgi:hypothetical protein
LTVVGSAWTTQSQSNIVNAFVMRSYDVGWNRGVAGGYMLNLNDPHLTYNTALWTLRTAEAVRLLRGQRVGVGCWFRLGSGSLVPGMSLRQSGKGEFLGGIEYTGGIADPAVWNRFEVVGRLRTDIEGLDIHIHCRIPEADPELLRKSSFYLDGVFLQAIEEPPLRLETPLNEYYVGETVPWTVGAATTHGAISLAFLRDGRPIEDRTIPAGSAPLGGGFETRGLKPGIHALQAEHGLGNGQTPRRVQRQITLALDPFAW